MLIIKMIHKQRFRFLQALSFTVILLFIALGPAYQQVLNQDSILLRSWTMYAYEGLNLCHAQFYILEPNQEKKPINWLRTLGYADLQKAPLSLRRLIGCEEALNVGKQLRTKLGSQVDLRLTARVSEQYGWRVQYRDLPIP